MLMEARLISWCAALKVLKLSDKNDSFLNLVMAFRGFLELAVESTEWVTATKYASTVEKGISLLFWSPVAWFK